MGLPDEVFDDVDGGRTVVDESDGLTGVQSHLLEVTGHAGSGGMSS
jgi:hypothetical protein